ncbi:hypothetical protein VTO42DRAFT_2702 [Malbranchea cinnamomea]
MKFGATVVTLGLAIGASFAEPIPKVKRALQDYVDVITGINDQVNLVGTLFSAYTGGDASAIVQAGEDLVALINQGTSDVNGFDPLSVADGLSLVQPILDLTDDVNATIDIVISKEAVVDANNYHDTVVQNLQDQKAASDGLAAAITAKTPAELADLAAELAAGVSAAIQRGIDAYSD